MLSLDSKFFSVVPKVEMSKITMEQITLMSDHPLLFTGARAAFEHVREDFDLFYKKVTASVKDAQKQALQKKNNISRA